ncbi:zinc finger CCCH domain-containing protein 34-like [Impatiens glandulifera]|uniref:zinc finger CCCH domain-containing protein 34-like n=1 Tax=Impatiens glandulifera TaxID=253017 RepID=UPI001FB18DE3|nr:zinc finger CCCH domain-containing protein 34-like [Impatiens glandulifera]
MKLYGRTTGMEGEQSDPAMEWSSPTSDTGLEESFWQLGLTGGGEAYPERPDDPDCIYYLRTGFCGYGERCRFNHPRDRGLVMGAMRAAGGGEYPERVGQPVCQYYMRTGMCKYGTSCKYHHPRQGSGTVGPVALNISGYPIRPGEKECSYYVKTGQCKFGVTCKFDHPQPSGIQMPQPPPPTAAGPLPLQTQTIYPTMQAPPPPHHPSSQQYGVVSGNWPVARPTLIPGSYIQGGYSSVLFPSGMVSFPSFNPYQAPVSPVASGSNQSSIGAAPLYGVTQLSHSTPAYTGPYLSLPSIVGPSSSSQKEQQFPERPGQQECQYYMKTGDCKFGSSCRYHHPPEWSIMKTNVVLSSTGLPLRPGAQLCNHYAQNGVCKFGQSCKFDHSTETLSYNTSASSLADMPVAPYPVGSSVATLAPSSSSSSELKAEIVSGSNEALSTRISSSKGNSSVSIGSISSAQISSSAPSKSSETDEPIKSVSS